MSSGCASIKDFSASTSIGENTVKKLLDNFAENRIGDIKNELVYYDSDKLKSSLLAIKKGASIDEVSTLLSWKDFEGLVSEILNSLDFQCTRNFILTRPRMEIDVIGVKLGIAILIDCKHWKRLSNSALRDAVKKQIKRARYYLAKTRMKAAIPTIVTLYRESVSLINKVPIVPIFQLRSFLDDFYGNMDKLNAIKA